MLERRELIEEIDVKTEPAKENQHASERQNGPPLLLLPVVPFPTLVRLITLSSIVTLDIDAAPFTSRTRTRFPREL
jgi:hypothetical protein